MSKPNKFVAAVDSIWKAITGNLVEIIVAALLVTIFVKLPKLLQLIDPYARAVDMSYLHLWVLKVAMLSATIVMAWLILQFSFPTLDKYITKRENEPSLFSEDWSQLKPGCRVGIFFGTMVFLIVVIIWGA